MSTLYVSRYRVSDSNGIIAEIEDGDIESVDFSINNNVIPQQGMSFNSRQTSGFIVGNYECGFTLNSFVRMQKAVIDIIGNWDYTPQTNISVTFFSAYTQTFNTLGSTSFIKFNGVMPAAQNLTASSVNTNSSMAYSFVAQSYANG